MEYSVSEYLSEKSLKSLGTAIAFHCDALFRTDTSTDTYRSLVPCPALDGLFPEEGSIALLFTKLLFPNLSEKNIPLEYRNFTFNWFHYTPSYNRLIAVPYREETHFFLFSFLQDPGSSEGYLILSKCSEDLREEMLYAREKNILSMNYLYTMLVALDEDLCRNIHISEINLPGQAPVNLSYSGWRSTIIGSIDREDQPFFQKQTDPDYIQSQLANEDGRMSFEIRMHIMSGEYVWTRHSIYRFANYSDNHFQMVYSVQDVDHEKKMLNQQLLYIEKKNKFDSITQTYNRPNIEKILQTQIGTRLPEDNLSLICFVLKNLRDIHAIFFSQVANNILKQFSGFLKENLPGKVFIGHYSMPSFLCVCPDTDLVTAESMAEKILRQHEIIRYPQIGEVRLGISIISLRRSETYEDCLFRLERITSVALDNDQNFLVTEQSFHMDHLEKNADLILNKIENEIRENYASKLTLKSMSEKYFINSAYLGQLFIRKHQMTFNAFLWNERLSHAAFQLAHTNKFIYEIIEDVGCSNVNYFNRQFSRKYGVSPYTYRKNTAPNKAQ